MARGWESKSVESQMEERQEPPARAPQATREQLELTRRREGIESSRRGVLRELESATSELRRRSLQAALDHLENELRKLN